ncbi:MAG: hypothetical protein LBV34_10595, partial [Nocardiopsaceae bacterium]|nr:hypothetical protein [Nocardiopsaceae bacterium]
ADDFVILSRGCAIEALAWTKAAMTKLGLPKDPKSVQGFMGSETVTSPSAQFVLFTVKASSSKDAVARANALANAYLQVHNSGLTSSLTDTLNELNNSITAQERKLVELQAEIAAVQLQPTSEQQQANLTQLIAQQRQMQGRLSALQQAVKSYAASTKVNNTQAINGSMRFGPASAVPRSKIKYPVLYVAGGLFAGLAIGMGWVIVSALISTRPRRRYDIARALGAPVRLSIGRIRVRKLSARRIPDGAGGRGVQQIAEHLRAAIGREQGRASLAVIAADDPTVPAASIISTAFACVREGRRVVLADLTPGARAVRPLGCTRPGVHRQVAGQGNLTVVVPADSIAPPTGPIRIASTTGSTPGGDPELDHAYHSADLLLTLLTVDPGLGAEHLSSWASDAVVIVTAGKPSATKIRTIAELIRLSGTALVSAVIIGADRFDESLGALTFPEEDDVAEPSEEHVRHEAREARVAQPNGSPERGRTQPEPSDHGHAQPAERGHVRGESPDQLHAGTERRAESRPEIRPGVRSGAWRDGTSPGVKPARNADATMPDIRYDPLATRPHQAVDLSKDETTGGSDANQNAAGSEPSQPGGWRS